MDHLQTGAPGMGVRRFGRINRLGLWTLTLREIRRFTSVWSQTVAAPLITAGLFLAIFSLAVGPARGEVMGVGFAVFLAPGILMMTVVQNAFANTSSSIMISKVQGNIVDTLMPPLSAGELVTGYIVGGIVRGLVVALVVAAVLFAGLGVVPAHPLWLLIFVVIGSAMLGAAGMLAAILARKFDQLAAVTNFIVTPLSLLSGTFYSVEGLPAGFRAVLHANPVFYLIDGARYGTLGVSDSSPWLGLAICALSTAALCGLAWRWMARGWRLKA
jgi:ABC-2 type transport system permease protein